MPAEQTQRLDRITRPVENHVRRVEVDAEISAVDILEELEQGFGRLLAGLERERLSMARRVVADSSHQVAHRNVFRMRWIFRNEADMAAYAADSNRSSEITHCDSPLFAFVPGGLRNEAD